MGIGKTIVLTAVAMLTAEIVHSLYQDYGNEMVKAVKNIQITTARSGEGAFREVVDTLVR